MAKHQAGDVVTINDNTTGHGFDIGQEVLIKDVCLNECNDYVHYRAVPVDGCEDWFIDDDDIED